MTIEHSVELSPTALPLENYVLTRAPQGYQTAGVYIGAIVTSASGKRYQGCRAYHDIEDGKSKLYMFNRLDTGSLMGHAPVFGADLLAPGTQEPISVKAEGPERLVYTTPASRYEVRADGWEWSDFFGAWNLSVRRVGRPYEIRVPRQLDFKSGQIHRSEHGFVEGEIDGEAVRGVAFVMHAWSEAGSGQKFIHLPLMNVMNNGWLLWMVEFEDGGLAVGEARRGKPGTGWRMSYLCREGKAELTELPQIELGHSEGGPVDRFSIAFEGMRVEGTTDVCSIWPHCTFGSVDRITDPRRIRNSWANVEWNPENYKDLLAGLMNGTISKEAMSGAKIVGERILVPGILE
jgi:hypothetical protein